MKASFCLLFSSGIFLVALSLFFLANLYPSVAHCQELNREKPRLLIDPRGAGGMVKDVLFTPDGRELISIGDDKAIRFWDVESGELRRTLRGEIGDGAEGKLFAGAISPDGRWLAVGGWALTKDKRYGDIRILDLITGEVAAILRGHSNVIFSLAFSADGRWLASGGGDTDVRVWDCSRVRDRPDLEVLEISESQVLSEHSAYVFAVSFSPDGLGMVSGAFDKTLILWKRSGTTEPFAQVATLSHHQEEVRCAAFSPDGRFIASGGFDDQLLLWDGSSGKFLRALDSDMGYDVSTVSFSPDGKRVLASSQSGGPGTTAIYDLATGAQTVNFSLHSNNVAASAWHPQANLIATAGGDDNDIYLWHPEGGGSKGSPQAGSVKHHIRGQGRSCWTVAFATAGGVEVSFGSLSGFKGDNFRGILQQTFDFSRFTLRDYDEARDGNRFRRTIPSYAGNTLRKEDPYTLEVGSLGMIEKDQKRYDQIRSYSFSPDGKDVIVGSSFFLSCYQPGENNSFTETREFVGHSGEVWAISPSPDGRYLASASYDQTVRLWNLESGELLASLFVARNGEWVCWTPSGHYHASPGGEQFIGWHFNKGIDKMGEYFPSYVFRDQFHHPELVNRTILLGDFDQALAEVGVKPVTDLAEALPPRVDWELPAAAFDNVSGGRKEITVRARISSPNSGLEEVKLLLNGKAIETEFQARGSSMTFERNITMLPGENRLSIFARNGQSGHTSATRTLQLEPESMAEGASGKVTSDNTLDDLLKPNLYVLSVGISEYENEKISPLQFCDEDAEAIAAFYQNQSSGIFGKTEVKLLIDREATEDNIQDALDWLEENATQKDVVVLFLAAHGLNDEKGNFYLLPHDVNLDRLRSTGVAWDDFGEILGNLPSRVLMYLDTCHSGRLGANLYAMVGSSDAGKRRTRSVGGLKSAMDNSEAIRELTSEENGVVIMAASTGDEESVEHADWGHGAFTMGLLEGLSGKADVNGDGIVHLRELDFFISDRVKELTDGSQHPTTVKPSTISRLPVAEVR